MEVGINFGGTLVQLNNALSILVDTHNAYVSIKWWRSLPIPFLFKPLDFDAGQQALNVSLQQIAGAKQAFAGKSQDEKLIAEYADALEGAVKSLQKVFGGLAASASARPYN